MNRALRRTEGRGGVPSLSADNGTYERGVTPEEVGLCWAQPKEYSHAYKTVERWIEQMLILRLIREQTRRPLSSASTSPTNTQAETKEERGEAQ